MLIRVAAVGRRMPRWVAEAWTEYTRRLPGVLRIELREIPLARRGRNTDLERARREEGAALLAAVPRDARLVALDERGEPWTTADLAGHLERWMGEGRSLGLLIGGPDGVSPECLQAADDRWSLGPLTLPHPVVRIILAEQLYRAWSMLSGHPYHRA
jgi:23S rRNA (pseudouridine1915-N3)-methyltransferase